MNQLDHHEEELKSKNTQPTGQSEEIFDALTSESSSEANFMQYADVVFPTLKSFQEELEKTNDFMKLREYRINILNRDQKEMIQVRMKEVLWGIKDYETLKALRDGVLGGFIPEKLIDMQIDIILFYEKDLNKLASYIDEAKDINLEKIIIQPLFKALKLDPIPSEVLANISTTQELIEFFDDKRKEKMKIENENIPPMVISTKPLETLKIEPHYSQPTAEEIKRMKLHASPRYFQNIKKSPTKNFMKNSKRHGK